MTARGAEAEPRRARRRPRGAHRVPSRLSGAIAITLAAVLSVAIGTEVAAAHGRWRWTVALATGAVVAAGCAAALVADSAGDSASERSRTRRLILPSLLALAAVALAAGLLLWRDSRPLRWELAATAALAALAVAPVLRLARRGLADAIVLIATGPLAATVAFATQARAWSWEAVYAAAPIGMLSALVVLVADVERADVTPARRRPLAARLSRDDVVSLYGVLVALAFGLVIGGAVAGLIPRPTVASVLAIPLAFPGARALRERARHPDARAPATWWNTALVLSVGVLLATGYAAAIAAARGHGRPPFFLR